MGTDKSYQDLKAELDELLMWFEGEEVDLDKAVQNYEKGMKLIEKLEKQLQEAENKIKKVKENFNAG